MKNCWKGVWEGWGGGRAGTLGKVFFFFVLMTRNKQTILTAVHFFFSTDPSFPMGKKEGKRRERGGMAGGKENGRDVTVTEKCE